MSVQIRVSNQKDAAAVSAVLQRSYSVLLAADYEGDVLRAALPIISVAKPNLITSGRYFVAQIDDGPIIGAGGWADQVPGGRGQAAGLGHIRHVAVDPTATRLGVGAALMAQIMQQAAREGVEVMSCLSTLSAEPFYAAVGFSSIQRLELRLGGQVAFPIVEMERRLGQG